MNKIDYNAKLREFGDLIGKENKLIDDAKGRIQKLETQCDNFKRSCTHKNDDGSSAMKDISYWVSSPYTYVDDWTGDEMEGDNGYTQYEEECQICGKTYER